MAKNKDKYLVRKFLNDRTGMAAIQISGSKTHGFSLVISDCYKAVTIDMEHYSGSDNDADKKRALKKLNLLISELEKAREFHFGNSSDNT